MWFEIGKFGALFQVWGFVHFFRVFRVFRGFYSHNPEILPYVLLMRSLLPCHERPLLSHAVRDRLRRALYKHALLLPLHAPQCKFQRPAGKALPYHNLNRHAYQIEVFELDSDSLIPVIQENVHAQRFQALIERIGVFALRLVLRVRHDDTYLERRYRDGPANPVFVVMRFDSARHRSAHAETVAPHNNGMLCALLILKERRHILAVLRSQFKDMPHLNTPRILQNARAATNAGVPRHRCPNVPPRRHREVYDGLDIDSVRVRLVRADYVGGTSQLVVYVDGNV